MSKEGRLLAVGIADAHGINQAEYLADVIFQGKIVELQEPTVSAGETVPLVQADAPPLKVPVRSPALLGVALHAYLAPVIALENEIAEKQPTSTKCVLPFQQTSNKRWGISNATTCNALRALRTVTGMLTDLSLELIDPKEKDPNDPRNARIPANILEDLLPTGEIYPAVENTQLAFILRARHNRTSVGALLGIQLVGHTVARMPTTYVCGRIRKTTKLDKRPARVLSL